MNFTPIDGKGLVEGFCLIKTVDIKTSSKGDTYLDLMLSDKEGEINAKLWNYNELRHGEFAANQIVKVRGSISVYNGNDQLRIEKIRQVIETDGVRADDFIKSADYSGEEMYQALYRLASGFENDSLRAVVCKILEQRRLPLLYWPAAFRLHHAIRCGLLMHTLSIVRLCEKVCEIYPFINKELLISGAILHDIAKLEEFEVGETGVASGYSVKGNLIGHLAEGAIIVRKAAEECGVGEDISNLLEHMLLSHHGEPDFGAAVRPMFIEAEVLSELDMLDARLYEMRESVSAIEVGSFSNKIWSMDNRKLYNHGLSSLDKGPVLFK